MKKVNILDIPITAITETELLNIINTAIKKSRTSVISKPITIFKPYVEYFNFKRYKEAKQLLLKGDIIIADSIALVWASFCLENKIGYLNSWGKALMLPVAKINNAPIVHRFNGIDITIKILELAQKEKYKVAVIGGPKDNVDSNILGSHENFLRDRFKGIDINLYDGYTHFTSSKKSDALFAHIKKDKVDILMLAIGFPKQEKYALLAKNTDIAPVIITEGGSFDYQELGGNVQRAPKWIQKINLEWLFRLTIDPKRIYRQLFIIKFIHIVSKNSMKS